MRLGDITLIFLGVLLLFGFGVAVIVLSEPLRDVLTGFEENPDIASNADAVGAIEVAKTHMVPLFDLMILIIFLAITVGMIIVASMVKPSPVTWVVFLVVLIILLVMVGLLTNVFGDLTSGFGISSEFTKTTALLGERFPLIVLGIGILVGIIFYSKSKSSYSDV